MAKITKATSNFSLGISLAIAFAALALWIFELGLFGLLASAVVGFIVGHTIEKES